jgi:hypothetical protein
MYDPNVGEFLSDDPIGFDGEDPNLSRYVGNSPTNFTDPDGLKKNGHHIIPWLLFGGLVNKDVEEVFDADNARIFNQFYKSHDKTAMEASATTAIRPK